MLAYYGPNIELLDLHINKIVRVVLRFAQVVDSEEDEDKGNFQRSHN